MVNCFRIMSVGRTLYPKKSNCCIAKYLHSFKIVYFEYKIAQLLGKSLHKEVLDGVFLNTGIQLGSPQMSSD